MEVLVIGGAGYIGSHVSREFLDAGHAVTVFDNLSSGVRRNLFPEAAFVWGDIRDYEAIRACMAKGGKSGPFGALVHLAAFKAAGESMLEPEKYSVNNLAGTVNILNAASSAGVKNVVFSSSAAVYGEPEYLPIDESHPTNPTNYYGFTKLEIERILGWYDRLRGIKFAALRYFNAAGYDTKGRITGLEQNPANLIPIVMETALGRRKEVRVFGGDWDTKDGTCLRDYVHVTDLAKAHVKALECIAKAKESLVCNLGSEAGFSVLEVIEAARRVTGKAIPHKIGPRRTGDPERLTASSKRARELLGWKAADSSLDSLVSTTWKAYLANEKAPL